MANETARHLRRSKTSAERRLWWKLRELKQLGFKFRQQVPIDSHIVDFACLSKRLVIEVDGATHSTSEERRRDAERDAYLGRQGFRVMRVWNREIFDNVDGVMDTILAFLNTPTPDPSPQGGGEVPSSPPLDGEGGAAEPRGWGGATHGTSTQEHPHRRPLPARGRGQRDGSSPPLDGEGGAPEARGRGGAARATSSDRRYKTSSATGEAGGNT
ncbi:MAG: DUF559 domain-containing protein [Hyphomicrobiaceae bacterium]|nr:DUF559 domain-containing protein [Hyphomicrobiaceae bacterium]